MRRFSALSQYAPYAALRFKEHFPLNFTGFLTAGCKIPAGSPILSIEDWISGKRMSTIESFKASMLTDIFEYTAAIHPNAALFKERLRISYQLSHLLRDKTSTLHDFAASFPSHIALYPIYWKDAEFTSSLPLRQLIADEYFLYRNSYDKIYDLKKQVLSNITFEEFLWANSVVYDKSVGIGEDLELVPIVDRIGNSFDANVVVEKDADVIRVVSKKDIQENERLSRVFGEYDNYTFLLKHGFVPDNNPFHQYMVSADMVPEWQVIVQKLGLNSTETLGRRKNAEGFSMHSLKKRLFQKFTKEGLVGSGFGIQTPAEDMEKLFRIVFLNESDMDERGVLSYSEALDLDFSKEITGKNERNVRVLIFKCADMAQIMLEKGFVGKHPDGRKVEEIDKEIVMRNYEYYKQLCL
jgi:hypothetical protein